MSLINEVLDFVKYDLLKMPLEIPANFSEKIFKHKLNVIFLDEGGILIESKDYPGLYATGKDWIEARSALYDTILTYFDVPRAYAKRRVDDFQITNFDDFSVSAKSSLNRYAGA